MTSILNNYCALIELWKQSLETRLGPDVKGRIICVKSQMMILFGLLLCDQILNITDNLSKTLQSQCISAVEAQHIADDIYVLDFATKTSTDLGVAEPALPRPRKVSRRLDDGAISASKVLLYKSTIHVCTMKPWTQHKRSIRSARISHVSKS